ncbi:MAG: 2-oxo acid dehydrogenase subunit E2, partial [Xanthomonadaceae bacterium]|nr:2-oxo acid dehydrogenase subunit E2 [Xanthomonadaceae bacterium]
MADLKEARVPDIGSDKVPVIEVMIKVGDRIEKEQSLITLESDKATMEVPAPFAGTVKEVKLKVGDEVAEGTVIAIVEAVGAAESLSPARGEGRGEGARAAAPPHAPAAPQAARAEPARAAGGTPALREAVVPDIGSSGVPVIEVLVKVGDTVVKDQGLITLESDKATMEVPAAFGGVVRELKVKLGDELSEGSVIAILETVGAADTASPSPAPGEGRGEGAGAAAQPPSPAPGEGRGEGARAAAQPPSPTAAPAVQDKPAPIGGRSVQPGHAPEGDVPVLPRPPLDARIVMPGDAPYASPAIRAFARELGVDIGQVKGSGRGGRIQREDVSGYVKHALATGARPAVGAGVVAGTGLNLLPWPKVDFAKFGPVEEKPLSRIQKISGANLARNWAMIPHVTQHEDADITELEAFRKKLGEENKELKISPLVFQIKAVVAALKAFPQFNASLDESGEK